MFVSWRRLIRRYDYSRLFLFSALIIFTALCSLIILVNYLESFMGLQSSQYAIDRSFLDRDIPDHCICIDHETSTSYNFCYRSSPEYDVIGIGKRFSCNWLPILNMLGLLNLHTDYFRFDKHTLPDEPPFVSASSDSHFGQLLIFITSVHKNFESKTQRIIVYDLGLSQSNIQYLDQLCNVEHRRFPFDLYPTWVRRLNEYRWKPLVIAEALKEFRAIWYMDSSVQLEKGNLSHVYALLNCRNSSTHAPSNNRVFIDDDFIESGFHDDLWSKSIQRCDKFAYMLQGFTGHGIFSATHPGVYEYIPTNMEKIKQPSAKMYEAGHLFVVRTAEVIRDILKWYVLCALEKDCMAPAGSSFGCSFHPNDRYAFYAHCHRYDQSIVNLLLANRNYFDRYYWTSGIVDFFHIVRGGGLLRGGNAQLKNCSKKL